MKTVDLSIYAPIISDKNVGEKIYQTIMEAHPESNDLQICLRGVISMTTFAPNRFSDVFIINWDLKSLVNQSSLTMRQMTLCVLLKWV